MAKADKLAIISKAVLAIYLEEFINYSLVIKAYKCDYIAVFKRVYRLAKI
jgi:hypothetical protein